MIIPVSAFVVSHRGDKNKDVPRMGHPLWLSERGVEREELRSKDGDR